MCACLALLCLDLQLSLTGPSLFCRVIASAACDWAAALSRFQLPAGQPRALPLGSLVTFMGTPCHCKVTWASTSAAHPPYSAALISLLQHAHRKAV